MIHNIHILRHMRSHRQDITSWYHMVTHCYQAAWSPSFAFLASTGMSGHLWRSRSTHSGHCVSNAVMSQPLHFKYWQPVGGCSAEEARARGQLWIEPRISHIHANIMHTIHRCVQNIHIHTYCAPNVKCDTYIHYHKHTQVYTHTQCGAMAPVARDKVLISRVGKCQGKPFWLTFKCVYIHTYTQVRSNKNAHVKLSHADTAAQNVTLHRALQQPFHHRTETFTPFSH